MAKNSPANEGDVCSIPGSGRSPGEGNDNVFQYCCLGNPMDRGAWWAAVYGVTESDITEIWAQRWTQVMPNSCNPVDCRVPGFSALAISRQEYWSGLSFPSPADLPHPGIKCRSPSLQVDSLSQATWEAQDVLNRCTWPWKMCLVCNEIFILKHESDCSFYLKRYT